MSVYFWDQAEEPRRVEENLFLLVKLYRKIRNQVPREKKNNQLYITGSEYLWAKLLKQLTVDAWDQTQMGPWGKESARAMLAHDQ